MHFCFIYAFTLCVFFSFSFVCLHPMRYLSEGLLLASLVFPFTRPLDLHLTSLPAATTIGAIDL